MNHNRKIHFSELLNKFPQPARSPCAPPDNADVQEHHFHRRNASQNGNVMQAVVLPIGFAIRAKTIRRKANEADAFNPHS